LKDARFVSRRGRYEVRVAYQDTDQAGVVHHATYLRYLEGARVEFWRANGFDYRAFEIESGLVIPVVEVHMAYKLPAVFDDRLVVETWAARASRASVSLDSSIARADGELLLEATVRLACVARPPEIGARAGGFSRVGPSPLRRVPDRLLEACLEPGFDL
jgi:acyl-CoA thioester hydrolase